MKKYKILKGYFEITEVDVIRETEKQVITRIGWNGKERREAKETEYYEYHDTWEAAHARLMDISERDINFARQKLDIARAKKGNVEGMKKTEHQK